MRHRYAIAHYGAARQLTAQPGQAIRLFAKSFCLSPFFIKIYPGVLILIGRKILQYSINTVSGRSQK